MIKIISLILITIFTLSTLHAEQDIIENLLLEIQMEDLSEKTKLANGGISYIITRSDLDRMQANTLKDVLKSSFPSFYIENRYGMPDPYSNGTIHPFVSSTMRIFIDNQEISMGMYGSGTIIYGDIDLGFVDHIEVYMQNPSLSFSSEPVTSLIKLYSKSASRDSGTGVKQSMDSRGSNFFSAYNSEELDDLSYFTYASYHNYIRAKHNSSGTPLSRDKKKTHIFASIYNDNHRVLIEGLSAKKDTFIDSSFDATPTEANVDVDYLHIGYDGVFSGLKLLASFSHGVFENSFKDNIGIYRSINSKSISDVYNLELMYDYESDINRIVVGAKSRVKLFSTQYLDVNGIKQPTDISKYQTAHTVFAEDQISLAKNSILNFGLKYSRVETHNCSQQDDLYMGRVSHTYATKTFTTKVVLSHMEFTVDPYLAKAEGKLIVAGGLKKTQENSAVANIIFESGNSKYSFTSGIALFKDAHLPQVANPLLLDNYKEELELSMYKIDYEYNYNKYDKFQVTLNQLVKKNIPSIVPNKDSNSDFSVVVRNLNTYNKFDIFNELIYYKDSNYRDHYYDYSFGVKYNHTDNFTISIKGENIFDKAREVTYPVTNPITFAPEEPLRISPIDRNFILSMEYLF